MAKNILIFSDGTGQAGGQSLEERRSNIYKLYRATRVGPDSPIDPAEQVAYYDAGLGSRPPGGGTFSGIYRSVHNFLSQATGLGITTNLIDCYEMIIRLWRPGDRIFLFGFSRGAYTVRCLAGVLALCGIPTRLEDGAPMRYDSATARRLARIAVKKVYQHTASRTPSQAKERELELLDQRNELARQFCETYGSKQDDKSEYPYFIGVFDTVASIANKGALLILAMLALAFVAGVSWLLWLTYPTFTPLFGDTVGGALSWLFGRIGLDVANWFHWLYFTAAATLIAALLWYVIEQVKFAPSANPKKFWRTLNISFSRMAMEDKNLNDNVRYARHAISIDENRAAFPRVRWGSAESERPYQDEDGVITFRQYWFAGNHSDIGGSYPENESRLSDIALAWMVESATEIRDGLKINRAMLQLYPQADAPQHDQRREGFPLLTKWFGISWPAGHREIPGPGTTLHPSVHERFKAENVVHHDVTKPYRPETLRAHLKLADHYANIEEPPQRSGLGAYLRRYLLDR